MEIMTVGVDAARMFSELTRLDQHGKVALKQQLKRIQMAEFRESACVCNRNGSLR